MTRRVLAWALVVPLAVAGTEAAHAVAYRLAVPDRGARHALLAETGHRYLAYLPLVLALGTAVVLLAFALDVRARLRGGRPTVLRPAAFAVLGPLVYACQELFERLLHGGVTAAALAEPTFVLGLALQLPLAGVAYGVARLLLGAAASVARRIAEPRLVAAVPAHRSWAPRPVVPPRPRAGNGGVGTRGPPSAVVP